MIKKIKIRELKPGMFVSDINVPWIHHPFLRNSVKVKNEKILRKIINTGVWEVYIDTEKSKLIKVDEIDKVPEKKDIVEIAKEVEKKEETHLFFPLRNEIKEAEIIRQEGKEVIKNIVNDIRSGKSVTLDRVEEVVEKVVSSVVRNKYTLISVSKIIQKSQFLIEHSIGACALMVSFSKFMGYDKNKQHEIGVGAFLHDVGMSKIPTVILNKPGKLSSSESEEIKKHVKYGVDILSACDNISSIPLQITGEHHERYNGSGYPKNLLGDNISTLGQMMAIVDVYDVMTSNRGYRRAIHPSKALIELLSKADKEFKRELVHRFIQSVGIYPFGTLLRLANGLLGIVVEVKRKSLLFPVLRIVLDKKVRVSPYDIDLKDYDKDPQFKIVGIELPEHLFMTQSEINNILKLDIDN